MTSAAPTLAKADDRWGRGWWVIPATVVLLLGAYLIREVVNNANEVKEIAGQAAYSGASKASKPPPTSEPAPAPAKPAYFDYLECDHAEATEGERVYCEPFLMWPLTLEARQIITGEEGFPGKLNMANSKAVAGQIQKLLGVDQCQMSIGVEEVDGVKRRVVYPDLRKTKLVDCGAPKGTS